MRFAIVIWVFVVGLLMTPPVWCATRCPSDVDAARLLRGVVAPNWSSLTKDALRAAWPGLEERSGDSGAATILRLVEETPSGEVVCDVLFVMAGREGIKSFGLVLAGSRDGMRRLALQLVAALGFSLTREDRRDWNEKNSVILRQMQKSPPIGIDVDVAGSERKSYLTLEGYNFQAGGLRP